MTATVDDLFHRNVVPLRVPVPVAATQGTLALALQPRLDPPEVPDRPLASVTRVEERRRHEVEAWAHRFVQAAVEIVGGDRPSSQLLRHCDRDVHADLDRRAVLVARAGGHVPGTGRHQPVRPRVRSVHVSLVSPEVAETSAHVRYGDRSRAVAARFERRDERWLCTALEFA
ncbi:Rv3235 family protein [Nocardioides litoris]|uniref:Rv3235 family protein n=1 Tax=Nocardioides litoris TaxID=1926648 RepID=UPI001FE728A5|nr:Rv3235 family protein [Nocardioides litoris]